jgi:hypothetical protein
MVRMSDIIGRHGIFAIFDLRFRVMIREPPALGAKDKRQVLPWHEHLPLSDAALAMRASPLAFNSGLAPAFLGHLGLGFPGDLLSLRGFFRLLCLLGLLCHVFSPPFPDS